MCLTGVVVASWSLTQEVAGLIPFNDNYFLSLNLLNSVKSFRKHSIHPDKWPEERSKIMGGNIGMYFVRCERSFKFTIVVSKATNSRLKPTIKLQISNCYFQYKQITG